MTRKKSAEVALPSLPPRLLKIKQAAQYLSSTPWFVRNLIWSSQILAIKLGHTYLIDKCDLDAFIERRKAEAV